METAKQSKSKQTPSRSTTVILPELHATQIEVAKSTARFKIIAAGRRWGKGVLGIGECVKRAASGKHCWWIAPTFASAAYQAGWRMLEFYAAKIPGARVHLQRRALMIGDGWVQFKTSEEPDALRGESIDFAVVDEAAHVSQLQTIWELCLRPCLLDRRGGAWFISTPHGFNYFNTLYARGRDQKDWGQFQYSSTCNPHLDRRELEDICKDMPLLVKRQEIDAEFVQLAGALFRRENIKTIEAEPTGVRWVRSWDMAWTEKTTSDYTAGAKVGMTKEGLIVVSHMVCSRMEWPEAVRCVAATALMDGRAVRQGVECVGAQEGAVQTLMRDPLLAAHSIEPIRVHRDKLTRALPLVARSEQGKFAIVRGSWNQQFVDQLCSFPEGEHDDMVDAASGALTMMETPTGAWTATDLPATRRPADYEPDLDTTSGYEVDLSAT